MLVHIIKHSALKQKFRYYIEIILHQGHFYVHLETSLNASSFKEDMRIYQGEQHLFKYIQYISFDYYTLECTARYVGQITGPADDLLPLTKAVLVFLAKMWKHFIAVDHCTFLHYAVISSLSGHSRPKHFIWEKRDTNCVYSLEY